MRAVILIIVAACSVAVGRLVAQPAAATQPAVEESPHAQALRLVFAKCGDRIRVVDQENWWHDVKPRDWTVTRPFYPGIIDSTHLFVVSYQIDGKAVASWFVDTGAGTAQEARSPATRPGK